jgi:hypothetical protein
MTENNVTPRQRKGAIISGLVLGALVLAIYATVMIKFFVYG